MVLIYHWHVETSIMLQNSIAVCQLICSSHCSKVLSHDGQTDFQRIQPAGHNSGQFQTLQKCQIWGQKHILPFLYKFNSNNIIQYMPTSINCSQLMHCRVLNQNLLLSPTRLNSITNIVTTLQAGWFGVQFLVRAGDNCLF